MNEKLASIFAPFEVAKLAEEKGFNEWCACWCFNDGSHYSPVCDHFVWNFNNTPLLLKVPTHYQLIEWLRTEHEFDVFHSRNGWYNVQKVDSTKCIDDCININEALIVALNLIEVKPC